ncbi:hypothetical protein HYV74_02930 [Candidatus Uhrbacteria bacterium]|nr:hypothetical protein [Candidatus Uhrbacteria bacterium]
MPITRRAARLNIPKPGLWGIPVLLRTRNVFFLTLLCTALALPLVPIGFIDQDSASTLLTVSTFLFGIIAGFYIYVTSSDYVQTKSLIAVETATWQSLYRSVAVYHAPAIPALQKQLDAYLRCSLDFEILDYVRGSRRAFDATVAVIRSLPYIPERGSVHQVILTELDAITTARQQLLVLGTKTLSAFSWTVLGSLALLVVASLYGSRTGEWLPDAAAILVTSALVLILLIIRDLDTYIWNERTFGFEVEENLFRSIGELPYYPEEAVRSGRVSPPDCRYRVGVLTRQGTRRIVHLQANRGLPGKGLLQCVE